jgi:RNA polymerase sigma-70 factor (ECF subfamily)
MGTGLTRFSSGSVDELIRACAELDDGEAWEEFVSRFHRAISLSVIRTASRFGDATRQVVDDLVQETYLKLCADKCHMLLEFSLQHPEEVVGYIKTITVNVARDHFKSRNAQKRGHGEAAVSVDDVEPTARTGSHGGKAAMEREILLKQINRCLEACSQGPDQARDRLIFWMYYQQGMSAKAIATLPNVGLTAKGVESALLRLTRLVREQIVRVRSEAASGKEPGEKGFRSAESY